MHTTKHQGDQTCTVTHGTRSETLTSGPWLSAAAFSLDAQPGRPALTSRYRHATGRGGVITDGPCGGAGDLTRMAAVAAMDDAASVWDHAGQPGASYDSARGIYNELRDWDTETVLAERGFALHLAPDSSAPGSVGSDDQSVLLRAVHPDGRELWGHVTCDNIEDDGNAFTLTLGGYDVASTTLVGTLSTDRWFEHQEYLREDDPEYQHDPSVPDASGTLVTASAEPYGWLRYTRPLTVTRLDWLLDLQRHHRWLNHGRPHHHMVK